MLHRSIARYALSALASLAPCLASAQTVVAPAQREGTVLRLDGAQLVIDLGRANGIDTGSTYTVYRAITVTHPVTGRVLHDRFPIGAVVVDHAGETLSMTHPQGTPSRPPRVGDVVAPATIVAYEHEVFPSQTLPEAPARELRVTVTPHAPVSVAAAPVATGAPLEALPCPTASPDERAVAQVFAATLGVAPELRIQRYERFLNDHPHSPYAQSIGAEVRSLVGIIAAMRNAANVVEPPHPGLDLQVLQDVPESLHVGDPAEVALQLQPESAINNGALYVRRRGQSIYERIAMRFEGDGYLRADVPQGHVTTAGFEYFVEVVPRDGRAVPLLGNAADPRSVEVIPPPEAPPGTSGRTRIDLRGEYADVGTRTIGDTVRIQRFVTVEGDFLQRLGTRWLYGYRVGFGVYDGNAIPLALISSTQPSVHTQVVYGYHELEFALTDFVHLIARGELGVFQSGLTPGFQARLRLGNERRTNIVMGGDVLGQVGQRAFFALNFAPTPKLPMMAQGEVFNQSVAAGDPMFRFIGQVGYRVASWCALSLRGSYQLRNIENGGFGAGLSTTFDW